MATIPKTPQQQLAEGDPGKYGKRKLEQMIRRQARPESGYPKCPAGMDALARKTWRGWVEQLEIMNLDKKPDAESLAAACIAYSQMMRANEAINKNGLTMIVYERDSNGNLVRDDEGRLIMVDMKKNPDVDICHKAMATLKTFVTEFGFTPMSRVRMSMAKTADAVTPQQERFDDTLDAPREPKSKVALSIVGR
jgi:P27 family predicted phage terminase small subunit